MKKVLAIFLIMVASALFCKNSNAIEAYIPNITSGGSDWTDYLQVNNSDFYDAVFTLTLYNDGTEVYSQEHTAPGLGHSLINLKSLSAMAETGVISYTNMGLSFRISYKNMGGGLAEFKTMDTLNSTLGLFFSDFTSSVEYKAVAIANLSPSPVDVVLHAVGQESILGAFSTTIGARDKIVEQYLTWFPSIASGLIKGIVAVTTSPSLCGIVINADNDLSHLLFTAAASIDIEFISPTAQCGAYVAQGVWKNFDCYNLAAIGRTSNDNPFVPSWRLIGGYWQWGILGLGSSLWYNNNITNYAHGPTGPGSADANADAINGWSQTSAGADAWTDNYKTPDDPCPTGFRVPTKSQWDGVAKNNPQILMGSWSNNATNYNSAHFFGNNLMLPTAGYRGNVTGILYNRGNIGTYWSSTSSLGGKAWDLSFISTSAKPYEELRGYGFPIRCIKQ